jgi:FtsH-binding integral membrane protein
MYMNMFKTFPHNVIFLTVLSAAFGVLVGQICAEYKQESVVFVFFATSVMICGLTGYAVKTSADFTSMGAYVFAAVLGLMLASILAMWTGMGGIIAGLGATVFAFIIVYDTQLIFGNSTPVPSEYSHHQHQRQFEYTLDMYARGVPALSGFHQFLLVHAPSSRRAPGLSSPGGMGLRLFSIFFSDSRGRIIVRASVRY